MASLHQNKTAYQVRWKENGKSPSRSFKTKKDAQEFRRHTKRRMLRANFLNRIDLVTEPLKEIIENYTNSLGVAPITLYSYKRSIFRPLLEYFPKGSINSLTTLDLQSYFASRRKIVQPSTLGKEYSILKAFFAWATAFYMLPMNPLTFIRIRRIKKSPGICLSYSQEWKLLNAATSYQRTKILLARDLGLRASNLGLLRRSAINFEDRTITFNILKKGCDNPLDAEARTLPLTNRLTESLSQFRKMDSQELLFTYQGKALRDPDKFLKRLRPRLGFHFRWHDLRHTFYTRLLEGCSNYALAEWSLGHSITYWHPTPETIRKAFEVMESNAMNALTDRSSTLTAPGGPRDQPSEPLSPTSRYAIRDRVHQARRQPL